MQDPREIEAFYQTPDPWGYRTNSEDQRRKDIIVKTARAYLGIAANRALDLGAGEGWITKDLPASVIHGYEISDAAARRFPANVHRVIDHDLPVGPGGIGPRNYDLIIATGVMYEHYDWRRFLDIIKAYAGGIVILCNIKDWEIPAVPHELEERFGEAVEQSEFPYREYVEKIRVYDASPAQHREAGK